jgi:tetratricopeptide (TPR) repeat protein
MRHFLLSALFLIPAFSARGGRYFDFNQPARQIYQAAFDTRFDKARQALATFQRKEPDNQIAVFLEHYLDFLTVVAGNQDDDYQRFQKQLLPRIDKISRGDANSPWRLFCQAEMRLQGALLAGRAGNYLSGLSDVKIAYALLAENRRRFPDFMPNLKSLGLLNVLIGSIPEEYRWTVKALGGIDADLETGRNELAKAAELAAKDPARPFAAETILILGFVQLYAEERKELAWKTIQSAGLNPRTGPLAAYLLAVSAARTGRNDEAIQYLEACPSGGEYAPFPYRYFSLGLYKLYRLDADADKSLERFLKEVKSDIGVAEAMQKLAWFHCTRGNTATYKEMMQKIAKKGAQRSESDQAALQEALRGEKPNPVLLRARLLFDGGYYQRAYELLQKEKSSLETEADLRLEAAYRLGRCAHELRRLDEAVRYYGQTIELGAELPLYFACNAALQLGLAHETRADYPRAREAFNKCLALKPDSYAAGLHARAKAGIKRLPE